MELKVEQVVGVSWEDLKEVVREEQGRCLHQIHDMDTPKSDWCS